ncbi:MAG: outer membrane protein assembly factor BamE [Lysobacterales bacterium]|jgi:outer membrane protein assembly factor BamE (lipoprotein component of BamABCDE complex)
MTIRTLAVLLTVATLATGCNLIYKQNIQQGNALEQEDLDELYVGMNQRQVLFVLGTPSVQDSFNQDRWDYVQTFSRRGSEPVLRTVTLYFENGLLKEIVGQDDPFAASSGDTGSGAGTVASFTKPKEAASPQDAAVESVEQEVLSGDDDEETAPQLDEDDRDFQRGMEVLDQNRDDG